MKNRINNVSKLLWVIAFIVSGCSSADKNIRPVIPKHVKPIIKTSPNVVKKNGVIFELVNCDKIGRDVHCNFYLTADGRDTNIVIVGSSKIFDNAGNSYTATLSRIANKEGKISPSRSNGARILADLKTESLLVFPNISTKAEKISRLELVFAITKPEASKVQVVLYRNISFDEKPPPVEPFQAHKIVVKQFRKIESKGLKFQLINCKRIGPDVHCSFNLTANGRDVTMRVVGSSTIFDEFGNAYNANYSKISNKEGRISPSRSIEASIAADMKVKSLLVFPNILTKAKTIKRLEINFSTIRPAGGLGQVSYSDIPIILKVVSPPNVSPMPTSVPTPKLSAELCCDLNGEFRYLGKGIAEVKQDGDKVHMFLTWAPAGKGPHYEVKAKLTGNILEGEWFSFHHNKGWFYFMGEISPSGKMIDFSKSEDPIRSNISRVRLMKN